jgi:hypothetical protein
MSQHRALLIGNRNFEPCFHHRWDALLVLTTYTEDDAKHRKGRPRRSKAGYCPAPATPCKLGNGGAGSVGSVSPRPPELVCFCV